LQSTVQLLIELAFSAAQTREQVLDDLNEDRLILIHQLGQVEVAQRSHQNAVLIHAGFSSVKDDIKHAPVMNMRIRR